MANDPVTHLESQLDIDGYTQSSSRRPSCSETAYQYGESCLTPSQSGNSDDMGNLSEKFGQQFDQQFALGNPWDAAFDLTDLTSDDASHFRDNFGLANAGHVSNVAERF
jgi:hypothetical protein